MREKLIEWLGDLNCNAEYCKDCEFSRDLDGCVRRQKEIIVDRLIANGVTFATDNNVGDKGCEYCQEDADGYRKMMAFCSITNPFHGSTWQIAMPYHRPIQIFFCPMCGRKLSEPPKGE